MNKKYIYNNFLKATLKPNQKTPLPCLIKNYAVALSESENDLLAPHKLHGLRLVFILPDMAGVHAGFGVLSA